MLTIGIEDTTLVVLDWRGRGEEEKEEEVRGFLHTNGFGSTNTSERRIAWHRGRVFYRPILYPAGHAQSCVAVFGAAPLGHAAHADPSLSAASPDVIQLVQVKE